MQPLEESHSPTPNRQTHFKRSNQTKHKVQLSRPVSLASQANLHRHRVLVCLEALNNNSQHQQTCLEACSRSNSLLMGDSLATMALKSSPRLGVCSAGSQHNKLEICSDRRQRRRSLKMVGSLARLVLILVLASDSHSHK
jgi:predicted nucleic acid-binding Zn ribbon protein